MPAPLPAQGAEPPPFCVLVADDNPVLRVAIQGLIRIMGHAAEVVASGLEALDAASLRDYDLVLLDVQMPEMGGIEAAQRLRSLESGSHHPRIVGMSGDPDAREICTVAGMDEFLAKPVRRGDLIRVLSRPALLAS